MLFWEAVGQQPAELRTPPARVKPITTRLRGVQTEDRCAAMTRVGRRCRCRKADGSSFCAFHDPEISSRLRQKAAQKREARKKQMSALPDGYLKALTSVDGIAVALDRLYREVRMGIIPPRTAAVMLAIVDRLLEYDKLVTTVGRRRVNKKKRAREVRDQVAQVLKDLGSSGPGTSIATRRKASGGQQKMRPNMSGHQAVVSQSVPGQSVPGQSVPG